MLLAQLDVSMKNTNRSISITLHKTQVQKWIKDFNTDTVILNLIEERVGNTLEPTGTEDNSLNRIPVMQTQRS